MNLTLFATEAFPLRPSSLSWLTKCGVKSVLSMLDQTDESGPAADTGSVVHAGVAAFHLEPEIGKKVAAAVAAMQQTLAAKTFPLADANEARLYLEPYCLDPRNLHAEFAPAPRDIKRKDGSILRSGQPAIEVPVFAKLDPHPLDPTGQPVYIRGMLDQIRLERGTGKVCDLKTGTKMTGWEMIHDYALQQAAYVVAARQSGFDAEPGSIIRNYGYRTRNAALPSPDGVFWCLPFDVAGAHLLLDRVRLQVALIRRGEVDFGPGTHCSYCPQKGLDTCVPHANRKLFNLA